MKKYILIVLLLIAIISIGCNNKEINYLFDKDNPTEIVLQPKKKVSFMNITGDDFYKEWSDLSLYQKKRRSSFLLTYL